MSTPPIDPIDKDAKPAADDAAARIIDETPNPQPPDPAPAAPDVAPSDAAREGQTTLESIADTVMEQGKTLAALVGKMMNGEASSAPVAAPTPVAPDLVPGMDDDPHDVPWTHRFGKRRH